MTAAIRAVIAFAFNALRLHPHRGRLPACKQRASMRLLERSVSAVRAARGVSSASTAAGRTTFSTASSRTVPGRDRRAEALFRPTYALRNRRIARSRGLGCSCRCRSLSWFSPLSTTFHGRAPARSKRSRCPSTGERSISPVSSELFHEPDDRIQVPTAPPRRHRPPHRDPGAGRRRRVRTGPSCPLQQRRRADRPAPRLAAFQACRLRYLLADLGASRIANITPSQGFAPERQESQEADVFRITLDPGAVVTFVAELRTEALPQLYLWDADIYKDAVNSYSLYRGIVLGISGLLALFLTIVFVVKRTAMFPATAALAWAVLIYLCRRLRSLEPGDRRAARRGSDLARRCCAGSSSLPPLSSSPSTRSSLEPLARPLAT